MTRFAISGEILRQGAQIGHCGAGVDFGRSCKVLSILDRRCVHPPCLLCTVSGRVAAIPDGLLVLPLSGKQPTGASDFCLPPDNDRPLKSPTDDGTHRNRATGVHEASRQIDAISSGGRDFGKNCSRLARLVRRILCLYWWSSLECRSFRSLFHLFMDPCPPWPNSITTPRPNSFRRDGGMPRRQPLGYRRFDQAAQAIRFAIEDLPAGPSHRGFSRGRRGADTTATESAACTRAPNIR